MNSLFWWLANCISRLLQPAEREAVCGDLAESSSSGIAAFAGVLNLVARRQLAPWRDWHPWLALVGIVLLVGFFLGRFLATFETGVFLQLRTFLKYGVRYESGGVTASQDACHLAVLALVLLAWSWSSGFMLASLSRRTLWLTAPLFYVAVQDGFFLYAWMTGAFVIGGPPRPWWPLLIGRLLPLNPALLFLLLAAIFGALRGRRPIPLPVKPALFFAASTLVLGALLFWTNGWYEAGLQNWSNHAFPVAPWPQRMLPMLLASWPAAYLPFLNRRKPLEFACSPPLS